ncbi:hypothetical protein HanLR1_Chr03g0113311 [Helianthus annuus]|nr:hypothetical protein HanHA89_Chr03g0119911 [Helianthus annuus]KAJ0769488.1 hypothetical protein HanLR1_Chr03g0113311 [Helianthus annuus]
MVLMKTMVASMVVRRSLRRLVRSGSFGSLRRPCVFVCVCVCVISGVKYLYEGVCI